MGAFIFGTKELGIRTGEGVNEAPMGPEPAAPCGRNRQDERRESQGALARLCEFPGSVRAELTERRRGARANP